MNARTANYLIKRKVKRYLKANPIIDCAEFPHFGARYPDATCIDGLLWDLDSGDGDGLTSGGSDPCPFCQTDAYVQDCIDNEVPYKQIFEHIKFLNERYGTPLSATSHNQQ